MNSMWLLALKKGDTVMGYYKADDEEVVTRLSRRAKVYTELWRAQADQSMIHQSWDLAADECFAIVPLEEGESK